jgi:putative intracellular protease/amidase
MKTLLILYPGCIAYETSLAAELLNPHFPVQVATPDGAPHLASSGLSIAATLRIADADPAAYRVILVPGGDPESVLEDADLAALLARASESGAWIGAICAGPLLLSRPGLLRGKRFTHGYKTWHQEFLAPFWDGAHYVDEPVVRDGNVITAMAEGHVDFAIELLAALDLLDEPARERKRAFYKGVVQPASPPPD